MKYYIDIARTVIKVQTFEVEAKSEGEAREIAYDMAYDFDFNAIPNSGAPSYECVNSQPLPNGNKKQ